MHVLITGGAGFIGSHLTEYHLNKGDMVHVVDDLSTGNVKNIFPFKNNPNFTFTEADLINWRDINKVVYWADRIYHMAGLVGLYRVLKNPIRVLTINIAATERLIRAMQKADWKSRLVLASTSEVYGNVPSRPLSEVDSLVIDSKSQNRVNYVISKLADEAFGLSYYLEYKLPVTVLRIFNLFGPRQTGQYGMVVPKFVEAAVKNKTIEVIGTGEQTRSFCDIRDFVCMLDLLLLNPESIGQVVNIGHDQEISILNLAHMIKKLANSCSKIEHTTYKDAYQDGGDDYKFRRPDLTKLHSFINYQYQWDLEKSLLDLIYQYRMSSQSSLRAK